MDVGEHFRTILAGWWRILIVAVLVAGVTYAVRRQAPKQYQALGVVQVVSGASLVGFGDTNQTQYVTDIYATLGKSSMIVTQAIESNGVHADLATAQSRLSVDNVALGVLLVKANGPSVHDAVGLAKGVTDGLVNATKNRFAAIYKTNTADLQAERRRINEQLAALSPQSREAALLRVRLAGLQSALAQRAALPTDVVTSIASGASDGKPISPKPGRDAEFAFIAAALIASELWVLRSNRTDRFSSLDETEMMRELGLPVLARVPSGKSGETLESIRTLRTNLMFLSGAAKPRTVAVVSANPEAGKTFVAVQLAEAAAAVEDQVVFVDADLRRPSAHEQFGVRRAPGLTGVLQGADVAAALRRARSGSALRVLPSGSSSDDPSALLSARAFRSVLDQLRSMRLVVVDTPPVSLFADALAVASQCDATVFVLDMKSSRKGAVRAAIEALRRGGANVIGVVVNRTNAPRAVFDAAA